MPHRRMMADFGRAMLIAFLLQPLAVRADVADAGISLLSSARPLGRGD